MATSAELLPKLQQKFPASQVKKNQDGLDYVSIDGYINRLLDALGLNYSFIIVGTSLEVLPEDMKTRSGKRQYLAQVTGQLNIPYETDAGQPSVSTRSGTGADVSFDPDKAIKTAQAEALKKAAHQFGIALELWDEGHRRSLELARRANESEQAAAKAVYQLALEQTGKAKLTQAEVAKHFGVKTGDLKAHATSLSILEDQGVI